VCQAESELSHVGTIELVERMHDYAARGEECIITSHSSRLRIGIQIACEKKYSHTSERFVNAPPLPTLSPPRPKEKFLAHASFNLTGQGATARGGGGSGAKQLRMHCKKGACDTSRGAGPYPGKQTGAKALRVDHAEFGT